uniref:Capsid protein n=1 Tax=Lone star tick nodavirus TaxID=2027377 RepID=A0A223PQZ6_9VIRU|nr:ORF1 [Lone star tick nodavirus]
MVRKNVRRRRARASRGAARSTNTLTISGTEFLCDVTGNPSTVTNVNLIPGDSKLPTLDAMAKLYEHYQIVRLVVHYRSAASTQTSGIVVGAVNWDKAHKFSSKTDLYRASPRISTVLWKDASVTVPPNLARVWNWQKCKTEGIGWSWTADGSGTHGAFWVTYTVRLAGPTNDSTA